MEDTSEFDFRPIQVKLILAAEILFAHSSIESVSMRQIAMKAKQKNHYAVQYHFGSKDKLVKAVFTYRMWQMEKQRESMLQDAEKNNKLDDLRTLLDIVFLPQLSIQDADGNHSYANFLCQFLLRQKSTEFGDFGAPSPPALAQVMGLLQTRLGHLPAHFAQRRLIGMCLVFLNILIHKGEKDTGDGKSFEIAIGDTMTQIQLALDLPLYLPQKSRRRKRA